MAKVGFVGIGNMGGPMVRCLAKAGHQVRLFDLELPSGFAYWVVAPKAGPEDPRVAAFRAWMLDARGPALL